MEVREMIAFRDQMVRDYDLDLLVHTNEEGRATTISIRSIMAPRSTRK